MRRVRVLVQINNGHNNLARVVFTSSPVLRMGSTLKLPPSISPTASSAFGLVEGLASLASWVPPTASSALGPDIGFTSCVPPVMRFVFSGTESLGT